MSWQIGFVLFVVLHPSNIYQDGYWLVTVRTHGDFIVLPHWETAISTMTWYPTQSHYTDWANQYLPYCNNAEPASKWQVFKTTWFIFSKLPKRETDALLIWSDNRVFDIYQRPYMYKMADWWKSVAQTPVAPLVISVEQLKTLVILYMTNYSLW